MSYLKNKTVYLAGNIHSTSSNDYGVSWRGELAPILENTFQIRVINPCIEGKGDSAADQKYFCQLIKDRKFIQVKDEFYRVIRKDLRAVDKADFIICRHYPRIPTIGTIHEIVNAVGQKKPVLILVDEEDLDRVNPWLLTLIKPQWLFTTIPDMVAYLKKIDSGDVETSWWW